ncbi:MAG: Holliday junction branch migration protein RuvA [Clostridia bacterium]|nr:Holliday junction branch migration protein RuvA [Clostridia bacterium]
MIAYLRGKVLTTTEETVIVDVNGVGYEVYCTGSVFRKITVGAVAEIFTYMQVKEDGMTLFGFDAPQEKELFLKLISVSGVGPKLGISILASLSADEFAVAVATADVKRLSKVKGLGKKTAEKIVLELHGKISAAEVLGASGDDLTPSATSTANAKLSATDEEAVSALMNLGFTRTESMQAVKKAHDLGAVTVEEVIMRALQGF